MHHDVTVTRSGGEQATVEAVMWSHGPIGVLVEERSGAVVLTASFEGEEEARRCAASLGPDATVSPSPTVDWSVVHRDPVVVSVGAVAFGLDVGPTFGWGGHPTTRMVLDHLAAHPPAGDTVLDVGTGSGVLAVAAALLGARAVTAIDTDETAARVAGANVAANGVADRVDVTTTPLDDVAGHFDVVLANLLAGSLVETGADLARRASGGTLVVSGFGHEHAAAVTGALAPLGVVDRRAREGWVALVLA
jgi:ribosomal protein L11 methylase PrmA